MSAALSPSAASALLRVLSWVCCETLPGAAGVADVVDAESACELNELCALVLDALAPELAAPPDCNVVDVALAGSADVVGALNKPAACAVESPDWVTADGVNESCGSTETEACCDVALLAGDACVCCAGCCPSNPSFRFTTLVTDTIHLHSAAATVNASACRSAQTQWKEKCRTKPGVPKLLQRAIDRLEENFSGNTRSKRETERQHTSASEISFR
jgi:hypothetical protein